MLCVGYSYHNNPMSFILNDIQHAFKKSVLEQECAKLSDSKS